MLGSKLGDAILNQLVEQGLINLGLDHVRLLILFKALLAILELAGAATEATQIKRSLSVGLEGDL